MPDNELANVQDAVVGEVPPIPAATEPPPADPTEKPPVDEAPDPAQLKAEIEELKKQKEEAAEAAKKWRKEKAQARAEFFRDRQPPPTPPPAPAETGPPKPDDFDDYNKYIEALTDYKTDQKIKAWEKTQAESSQNEQKNQKMAKLQEKINEGFGRFADFEEIVLDPSVPITPMVHEILAETDDPAGVAYHLAKNQTRLIQIGRMSPIAAAREIAKIEAEIKGAPAPPPKPKPKPTTSAPPPITPVGSSNPASNKSLEDMTQAEYEAEMRKRGARPY